MNISSLKLFSLLALTGGCLPLSALKIVTTSPDLAWVAKQVAPAADVAALARGDQDPHQVEAKPSFILKLRKADVMIQIGMDLEIGYLPPLLEQSRNAKIQTGGSGFFNAADFIAPLDVPTGKVDRSLGDVHAYGNPHYQLDPENVARIGLALAEKLAEIDASGAVGYRERAKKLAIRLRALRAELTGQFASCKGRPVVVYHNALRYLSNLMGLQEVIYLEPLPGIPPSPAHIAKVVATMKRTGAKAIIVENYFSRREADAVAEKTGGRVVVVPISVGGDKESSDYETMMRHIAALIKAAM